MEAVKEFIQRKWTLVGIALVGGIILGVLYAWVLNPVEWINGEPAQLREDLQIDYLRMVIDSYSVNLDPTLAQDRYESLGDRRAAILAKVGQDPGELDPGEIQKFQALVAVESPIEEPPEPSEEAAGFTASKLLVPALIVTFVIGVLLAGALFIRRRMEAEPEEVYAEPGFEMMEDETEAVGVEISDQPLATFRTTYTLGDDLYDDSFSIESPTGDFLGECGVGIGEVIGVEEPKKVAAFEVWLFDKNDIQTVTKVLMSRYAFNDDESHNRLAAKGDPVLAESGDVVSLETASLKIDVRIVDMSYGEGPLPEESFFDRVTVELMAWQTAG
ncbi:MAG: hypothetical protein JSV37_10105 [Anaerolineaceae bacterium]|nr:MAG: hypothetical protein JSV37_10105 [Anaerolineaceae bacterium]